MIPRGEGGLIFDGAGRLQKAIDDSTFSGAVIMVIATTPITPRVLRMVLARREGMNRYRPYSSPAE
jgi:Kef-type K+ transport system membrane component KefB